MNGKGSNIFISYRRSESGIQAQGISDFLRTADGIDNVYLDVDSLPMGADFSSHLANQIRNSDALLVLISSRWLESTDSLGNRRIDDPGDFIRLEIRYALEAGIQIIPILLNSTQMPLAADLPSDIRNVAHLNAIVVGENEFDADMRRLVKALSASGNAEATIRPNESRRNRSRRPAFVVAIFSVLLFVGILLAASVFMSNELLLPSQEPQPDSTQTPRESIFSDFLRRISESTTAFFGALGWRDWLLILNSSALATLLGLRLFWQRSANNNHPRLSLKRVTQRDRIFISYRRSDSAYATSYLYSQLTTKIGEGVAFKDVDSIPYGVDFRTHVQNRLENCQVALVIIGADWLNATGEDGEKRLFQDDDLVRTEIEVALGRGIPVIPVLIGKNHMPSKSELPKSIGELADRNGIPVRPDPDFSGDVDRLARAL